MEKIEYDKNYCKWTTENKIDIINLSWFNIKWKLYMFIMGFTMHEKKTPVPPDAGCEI